MGMKFTKKDCIRLLYGFGEITEEIVDDEFLKDISVKNPIPTTTLLGFSWERIHYYALFDTDLNDNIERAKEQIFKIYPNSDPELVAGKDDLGGFFKGKVVYLFRERITKKRLDILASEQFPDISRSQLVKMIKNGEVKVDGETIDINKTLVSNDAKIEITRSQEGEKLVDIPVIFENENVVVINKPSGVLVHNKDGGGFVGETLVDFLEERIDEELLETEFKTNRTGIIHRLDRGTSGVMILAKNPETASFLSRQFADRKVKKTYFAVVHGHPKINKAVIDVPIARNNKAPTTFLANPDGKPAQTIYEVVSANDNFSWLKLTPLTGRTHQIRVHLAHINTPIVGDFIYNKEQIKERPFLHASELEITVPKDDGQNERMSFRADLPDDIKEFLGLEGLEDAG